MTVVNAPVFVVTLPITPWKLAPVIVFRVVVLVALNVVNAPVPGVEFPIETACKPPPVAVVNVVAPTKLVVLLCITDPLTRKVSVISPVIAVKFPTLTLANPLLLIEETFVPVSVVASASNAWSFSTQTHAVFTAPYGPKDARFLLIIIPISYPARLPTYPLLKTTKGSLTYVLTELI